MKEEAPKIIYRAYVDYGIVVIIAVAGVMAVWILIKYIKNLHEKQLMEKDNLLRAAKDEREALVKEIKRLNDTMDHANDVVSENSKALYENASMLNEVKGILVVMSERLKK